MVELDDPPVHRWLAPLVVFVLARAAFWSVRDGAFVNLDDE